jgi:hypothetical protein
VPANLSTSAVTVAPVASETVERSFTGGQLVLVRAVWVAITFATLALVITAVPIRYDKVRAADPYIRVADVKDLIAVGLAPDMAAAADLVMGLGFFLPLFAFGTVLFWRRSDSRQVSFLSLTLIQFGAAWSGLLAVPRTPGPPFEQAFAGLASTILNFLTTLMLFNAQFWLPEGRFVNRWTAWLMTLVTVIIGGLYFLVSYPRAHDLVNIVAVPINSLGLWNQVSHYRSVEDASKRQRLKWVMVGLVVAILGFLIGETVTLIVGSRPALSPRVIALFAHLLERVCYLAMLVCFAIAIVRYRMWQVDLVINRSLVYGTASIVLLVIFLGGGLVLQRILGPDAAPVAFLVSTMAAALLFNPARRRAQNLIDRRFYGFRFDLDELRRAHQAPGASGSAVAIGGAVGRYRIVRLLGRGGMGEVYEAERDGRSVALKMLPQEPGQQDFLKWFGREARALSALTHPNIVKFHEAGEYDGRPFMVLDYIEGRELSQIVRERGRMRHADVQPLLDDLTGALEYAHARGLVHRDVKPSNIMVRPRADGSRSEAVLMDFGIAKTNDALTRRTSTGAIGTISYMAPEQIMAATTVDCRADIYALGVTVYEMLTGSVPFTGGPAQTLFAHLQQRPTEPQQLVPDLPETVSRSVMKCLEKKPEDRFQSVGEFAVAFSVASAAAVRTTSVS